MSGFVRISIFIFQIFLILNANAETTHDHPRITIVGAGLAGLTTAYRLQKMGYSVEVYEARNRPGGRVCTAYFGHSYDELGGKNIDDASDPTEILNLIRELNLSIKTAVSGDMRNRISVYKGQMTPFLAAFKNAPEPSDANLAALREKMCQVASLGHLMDMFFANYPAAREHMEWVMSGYEGTDSHALSAYYLDISFWKFYKKYYDVCHGLDQENLTHFHRSVDGGNSLLIKALANQLTTHIHYNAPLRKIKHGQHGTLSLCFNKNDWLETDYLILALPCSTLRDVDIEQNLIPKDQMLAIQTLQYGTSAKILLPIKVNDEAAAKSLVTQNIFTWLNHDRSVMTWYYIGQKGAFDFQSTEVLNEKINEDIKGVQMVYKNIEFPAGLKPCPMKDVLDAVYTTPVAISWINEEFSKGSYSNAGINNFIPFHAVCEDYQETVLSIFRSIDNCIFFAGEHTDIEDFATMGGAVRSGERAARMLQRAFVNHPIQPAELDTTKNMQDI